MDILTAASAPERERTTGPTLYAPLDGIGPVSGGGRVYMLAHRASDREPFMLSASLTADGITAGTDLVAECNARATAAAEFPADDKSDAASAARKARKAIAADRTARVVAAFALYDGE